MLAKHKISDPSYWRLNKGNIERLNLCKNSTEFFVIDPSRISSMGGTKSSTIPPQLLNTNIKYVTDKDWIQPAAGFKNSVWLNKGWSIDNDTKFFSELENWIIKNFNNRVINPSLNKLSYVTVRECFDTENYTAAFCFFGS